MTVQQYLSRLSEPEPVWIARLANGTLTADAVSEGRVAVQAFLGSRVVFYPGSGFDGQPVMHFNTTRAAHAYVYTDYGIEQRDMSAAIENMPFKGYDLVRKVILNQSDMGATGWRPHIEPVNYRFASAQAYGFMAVFKRQSSFGPEHGADHFAVLFLGADGIATYDALFCQENGRTPPFSIVLQDHGFGGAWTVFGRGGAFERLAKKTKRFPQYLLVGTADVWDGFVDVHSLGENPDDLDAGEREHWHLFTRPEEQNLRDNQRSNHDPDDMAKNNAEDAETPLLPNYVYVLMDPANGSVFYVGKGTNQRALAHTLEVERLLDLTRDEEREQSQELDANDQDNDAKIQKIMDIVQRGSKPRIVVVGRYQTAEEAFAVEATLIHFVFGYDDLLNIANGHGSKLIRTREQFDAIKRLPPDQELKEISGIDIRVPRGIRDNSFRNSNIAKLTEAGAYEFLEDVHTGLVVRGFNCRKFETASDMRFHPGEANGYLAIIVRIASLDLNIQFTASKKMSIQLIYTDSTRAGESDQFKLLQYLGLTKFTPKANMKYAWLEYGVKYTDLEKLLDKLSEIRDVVTVNQSG